MNASELAIRIAEYVMDHPEKAFTIYDFEGEGTRIDLGTDQPLTYKKIYTAFENILSSSSKISKKKVGDKEDKLAIQYSVSNESEQKTLSKQRSIIKAISALQYTDLTYGVNSTDNFFFTPENKLEAEWMDLSGKFITIAEDQRILLDSSMLSNLITLLNHTKEKIWSKVWLIDENEEVREEPIEISLAHVILQDGLLHCMGIIKTEDGYTGDKFFLDEVEKIEQGGKIHHTNDYIKLRSLLRETKRIPALFSR
ncbi:MAG: hypothetical protein WD059_04080 [Balneolaceae bacterium]